MIAADIQENIKDKNILLEVTNAAKELLAEKGYDPNFGARPLRRVIQDEIEDLLSQELLEGRMQSGSTIIVDIEEGKFVVSTKEVPALP